MLPDGSGEDGIATTDKINIEWSSSNENVATVTYGVIEAKGLGTATITAKQGDLTATIAVTVADKIKLTDRSEAWKITDTPKWDKNWSGQITGSHEEVNVSGVDTDYHYFKVVAKENFTDIETISGEVYMQVEEYKDDCKDPKSLFYSGESSKLNYSDMGEAVAYVMGYDSEFEFTGEYAVYEFEARTPDPVHATGIEFNTGDVVTIKEGKNTTVRASVLPEDCTDVSKYVWSSADESVATVAYAYSWSDSYSYYVRITGVSEGETDITCTYADVSATLHVVVTGSNITLTDHSSTWKATKEVTEQWGWTVVNITVTACDAARFYATVTDEKPEGATLKSKLASMADGVSSYEIRNAVPAEFSSWDGDGRYIVILGFDQSGEFTGDYAIIDSEGGSDDPGTDPGDEPGTDPVDGKMVSMSNNYFSVTWEDEYKTLDEVTMEGWVYGDSFSGNASGNDGLASMMGVEGVFLIRLQNGKPEVVYGGTKKANGEYNERKVTSSTTLADKEWHHLAATYKRGGDVVLYIDGEQAGSNTAEDHGVDMNGVGAGWAGGGLADWHFYIGVSCQTSRDFDGSLAYLRVWDSARSASEIKDNMSKADPEDNGWNLLANWYFNEGSGNTVKDQTGYGYDLTSNSNLNWIDGTLPF